MLNLPKRELALVEQEYELPDFLAGGKPCFIRFSAKPAGAMNPEFAAVAEEMAIKARLLVEGLDEGSDDPVAHEKQVNAKVGELRLGALYDTCMVSWETNVQSDGKALEPTRENFLGLAATKGYPEITQAFSDLHKQCFKAGEYVAKAQKEVEKNS